MSFDMVNLKQIEHGLLGLLGPGAFVIAGGAVRDVMLSRPVKDIDIFIQGVPREERDFADFIWERRMVRKVASFFADGEYATSSESGYESQDEEVYATYEVQNGDGPALNLIFVNSIPDALNEFPDELSQVYLEEGIERYSDAFARTRVAINNGFEAAVMTRLFAGNKRLARLSEKYPEVRWLVPEDADEARKIAEALEWV